jgi:hypothetical protein
MRISDPFSQSEYFGEGETRPVPTTEKTTKIEVGTTFEDSSQLRDCHNTQHLQV